MYFECFLQLKLQNKQKIIPENNTSGPVFTVLTLAVQSNPKYCHVKKAGSYERQNQAKREQTQHLLNSSLFPMGQIKAGFENKVLKY